MAVFMHPPSRIDGSSQLSDSQFSADDNESQQQGYAPGCRIRHMCVHEENDCRVILFTASDDGTLCKWYPPKWELGALLATHYSWTWLL